MHDVERGGRAVRHGICHSFSGITQDLSSCSGSAARIWVGGESHGHCRNTVGDPCHEMADLEEVSRLISEGKPVADPALLKRIYERAEQVRRRDVLEKHTA